MIEKKVDAQEVFKEIENFYNRYHQYPALGFLAGLFKVNKATIYTKMKQLQKQGKITQLKTGDKQLRNTNYEINKIR